MSGVENRSVSPSPPPPLTNEVPIFPVEILNIIIDNVSDVLTLSRDTHETVEAALYHTLDFSDAESLYISPTVYRRFSTLSQHLLDSPHHASLVHKFIGMLWSKKPIVEEAAETETRALPLDQMPRLFTRLRELDLSYNPFMCAMPTNRGHFHAAVRCSSQELKVLILDSQTLCALASRTSGISALQKLVLRQKQLKTFKVLPFYPRFESPEVPINTNIILSFSSQQVECVEGSFWTLNSVLPSYVRPKKLRFIENADPFTQDLPVREKLLQHLQHVRVLSYCCNSEG